jgi:OmpA-OmpF porin, OOP family
MLAHCAEKVQQLVAWLSANPILQVGLDGHVREAQEDERAFVPDRVKAVRIALVDRGIAPVRIHVGNFGLRQPVCTEDTDRCRDLNRRIEVLVTTRQL